VQDQHQFKPHGWTHSLCDSCYQALEEGREPVVMKNPEREICCRCGVVTTSGIYYRTEIGFLKKCDFKDSIDKALYLGIVGS